MSFIKTIATVLTFLTCSVAYLQMEFPGFGAFSPEDIGLKRCSFDPEAEAIILLDKAVVNYDDAYHLITERRIRIKILSEKGLDRANIIIPELKSICRRIN